MEFQPAFPNLRPARQLNSKSMDTLFLRVSQPGRCRTWTVYFTNITSIGVRYDSDEVLAYHDVSHCGRSNDSHFLTGVPCPHKRPERQNRRDAREDEARLDGEVANRNEDCAGDDKSCEKCDSALSAHEE